MGRAGRGLYPRPELDDPSAGGIIIRVFAGYDPGGNGAHGVAALTLLSTGRIRAEMRELPTASEALSFFEACGNRLAGIGIDSLLGWSLGESGWRPADDFLRREYPDVARSVVAANSLRGSMVANGVAVALALERTFPELFITEVHPEVLRHAVLTKGAGGAQTSETLRQLLDPLSEHVGPHAQDALIAAFAALQGIDGGWPLDLHAPGPNDGGWVLVSPLKTVRFLWPELPRPRATEPARDRRRRYQQKPAIFREDLYLCPMCGHLMSSISDDPSVICKRCGQPIYKDGGSLVDHEERMQ